MTSPQSSRRCTRGLAAAALSPLLVAVAVTAGAGTASAAAPRAAAPGAAAPRAAAPRAVASLASAPLAASATTAKAEPAPHPVAPKMQVLQPRGVDAAAVRQLQATPQLRSALTPAPGQVATPALAIAPTRTSPFQLVGLTWATKDAPTGIDIKVRVREHGVWGAWQVLGVEDAGPDADTAEGRRAAAVSGSDPLLSNGADGVQVVVHTSTGRAPANVKVDLINAGTSAADGETPTPAGATVAAPDMAAAPTVFKPSSETNCGAINV